jgi:hypothetical protein
MTVACVYAPLVAVFAAPFTLKLCVNPTGRVHAGQGAQEMEIVRQGDAHTLACPRSD